MKKYIWLLFLVASSAFGQSYSTFNFTTTQRNTNTMIWNKYSDEWDFSDNNDRGYVFVEWRFTLNNVTGEGTLRAGNMSYDVLSTERKTGNDGSPVTSMVIQSVADGRKMNLLITGNPSDVFIGIYDNLNRTSYYYY